MSRFERRGNRTVTWNTSIHVLSHLPREACQVLVVQSACDLCSHSSRWATPFAMRKHEYIHRLRCCLPRALLRRPSLNSSHEEVRYEIIWTRHDWPAVEQDTRIIQFQDIRLATELWGVVDVYPVLDEPFVTAGITRFTSIDRYFEEGDASAAQGFQRDRVDCAPYTLEMVSQFLRSLGLGLPFLLMGLGLDQLSRVFTWLKPHVGKIEIGTGIVMIAAGVIIFFNLLPSFNHYFNLGITV